MTSIDEAGGGRRRRQLAAAYEYAGNGPYCCARCEGSGLCVKSPFSGTPLDWVFRHWSQRNVTSHHKDCPTKRAVGDCAVRKKARKYSGPQQKQTWRRKIQNDRRLGTVGIFTYNIKITWARS